jgi:hypothetical protein
MGSATARQRLGDRAAAGGYLDSGAVGQGLSAIDRGEAAALAQQISALTMGLYDRQEMNVLPFLSQGAAEVQQVQGMNLQAALTQRGQDIGFMSTLGGMSTDILDIIMSG